MCYTTAFYQNPTFYNQQTIKEIKNFKDIKFFIKIQPLFDSYAPFPKFTLILCLIPCTFLQQKKFQKPIFTRFLKLLKVTPRGIEPETFFETA